MYSYNNTSTNSSFGYSNVVASPDVSTVSAATAEPIYDDETDPIIEEDSEAGVLTTTRAVHLHGKTIKVVRKVKIEKKAEEAAAEESSEDEAPPPVEPEKPRKKREVDTRHIEYSDVLESDECVSAREARKAELERLAQGVNDAVNELVAGCDVTADFPRDGIDDQIAGFFGNMAADGLTEVDDIPAGNFSKLRALIERVRSAAAGASEDDVAAVFMGLADKMDAALQILENTANDEVEDAMVAVGEGLVAEMEELAGLAMPNAEEVVEVAAHIHSDCDEFESARLESDWTLELIEKEENVYAAVDQSLANTAAAYDEAAEALAAFEAFNAVAVKHGLAGYDAVKRDYENQKRKLEARESTEVKTLDVLQSKLDDALAANRSQQAQTGATIDRIADQIRALTEQLEAQQLKLFKQKQAESVIEQVKDMTQARFDDDTAENRHALELVGDRIRDAAAAIESAKIADDMSRSAVKEMNAIRDAREAALTEAMFGLVSERLALMSRIYVKNGMRAIAAEARIEMKKQQQEGVLVKKKRSNAAQDTEGVKECNESFSQLETSISEEVNLKAELDAECETIASDWQELYVAVGKLYHLTSAQKSKLPALKQDFETAKANVRKAEEESLRAMELADRLDAQFIDRHIE